MSEIKNVIFRFEFAQESKKFWKMDIDDVQKSICQNLFVKIRRVARYFAELFVNMKYRTIYGAIIFNYVHIFIFTKQVTCQIDSN